jgi:glycine cleavage system aminomethyltransferase T
LRTSPLKSLMAAAGAAFRERYGTEVVARFADRRTEYNAVRNAIGLTDFSWGRTFSLPEDKGIDFLDALLAGNVPKIRFGRVLHTFLADDDGLLIGDCYVANNDKEFLFICESILADAELDGLMRKAGAAEALVQDLGTSHALLSLDGVRAWEVVKKLFSPDVLGLPYLSIENYSFGGQPVRLFRAGKTSEFGYLLLAPVEVAAALFEACKSEVEQRGGGLCGVDVHDDLRLDGRFFNIHAEGRRVRDPLILGLQWMIDFDKEKFAGCDALKRRRAQGLQKKIIGIAAESGCEGLKDGARIYHQGEAVAEVVASSFSWALNQPVGLAVFPIELAFSGLAFRLGAPDGPVVRSISMPPIMPKSLNVKLDEM